MLKVLKKIYPPPTDNNYNLLNYDDEGLWSITHPNDADVISKTILEFCNKELNIIDLTAGCGGNLISFGKYFNNVTGIEYNKDRFEILKTNISCYNYEINIINDDCYNYLNNNYDIFFIDPPWGGPDYKLNNNLKLYLSNNELKDIIENIPKNKFIVIKIPFNYNYEYIKENYNILKIQNFNNIVIIYFKN
jgi:16S rRNA G966 N2-methylase RsmD